MNEVKERWHKTPKWIKITGFTLLGIAGAVLLGFLFGYLIQVLWNWLMPGIFGLREITYWEGVGLFILARFIFGCSFGGGGKEEKKHKHKKSDWDKAKEEIKAEFKKEFDKDCGKYYDAWWDEEGQKSYDVYVNKNRGDKEKHGNDENSTTIG